MECHLRFTALEAKVLHAGVEQHERNADALAHENVLSLGEPLL
jgi:hypothetical protein